MTDAALPPHEAERLAALYEHESLDTPLEKPLDDLVHLVAYICHAPIALISLVESDRQWVKSKVDLTETQTARIITFCAHTTLGSDLLVVPDALADERFSTNPLVTDEPHIRFYCSAPLRPSVRAVICSLTKTGNPVMKSRGSKLLLQMDPSALSRHAPHFLR